MCKLCEEAEVQFQKVKELCEAHKHNFSPETIRYFKDEAYEIWEQYAFEEIGIDYAYQKELQKEIAYFLWENTGRPEGLSKGFWEFAGSFFNLESNL